eukprot:1336188-Amphidinium_carterae.1
MATSKSQPYLLQQCAEAGLSEEDIAKFKAARIVTTGQLAFACSYVPGASDDKSFQDMVASIFGADVPVGL